MIIGRFFTLAFANGRVSSLRDYLPDAHSDGTAFIDTVVTCPV